MSEIEPSERASCGGHTPYDIRASQEIATHPPVPRGCEATLRVSKKRPVYAAARLPKRRLDTRAELDAPKQVHTYIDARRHLSLIAAHIAAVVVLPSVFVFSMLLIFLNWFYPICLVPRVSTMGRPLRATLAVLLLALASTSAFYAEDEHVTELTAKGGASIVHNSPK